MKADSVFNKETLLSTLCSVRQGAVLLSGPSGCGKTRILKELKTHRNIEIISCEKLIDVIVQEARGGERADEVLAALLTSGVIAIEDVDFLSGRLHTQSRVAAMINDAADRSLVILTGINLQERIPALIGALNHYQLFEIEQSLGFK